MIGIRPAGAADLADLERLLAGVHAHYPEDAGEKPDFAAVAREIVHDGYCDAVIARDGGLPVGLAVYTFLQPSHGTGAALFMKELFVVESARGRGVGRALMAHLARLARARGCTRFEWTTGRANRSAIGFYESLGAREDPHRVWFRVADEALGRFLRDEPPDNRTAR